MLIIPITCDKKMKSKTSYILSFIGLILLLYFIKTLNFQPSTLLQIKQPQFIPLSIAAYILFFPVSAIRAKYLLKSVNHENHSTKTLTEIEFISKYIYLITPSKLYLPAKAILLNKLCNIKKSTGLAIVTFEYGIDVFITILLALIGSLFLFRETLNIPTARLIYILITITAIVLIYISMSGKIIEHSSKKVNTLKNKFIKKNAARFITIIKVTRNTWSELIFNKKMKYILPLTIIQITLTAISTKLLFLSLSTNVPIHWIIIVSATAVLIGGISQVPGGIGIREATGVLLYSTLGIPKEISLIVVLITRMYTLFPLLIGYTYSMKCFRNQKSTTSEMKTK